MANLFPDYVAASDSVFTWSLRSFSFRFFPSLLDHSLPSSVPLVEVFFLTIYFILGYSWLTFTIVSGEQRRDSAICIHVSTELFLNPCFSAIFCFCSCSLGSATHSAVSILPCLWCLSSRLASVTIQYRTPHDLIEPTHYPPAAAAKSLQSCPTLCDPIDGSPPGSPVPGICQARVLEWGAIAFSDPPVRSSTDGRTLLPDPWVNREKCQCPLQGSAFPFPQPLVTAFCWFCSFLAFPHWPLCCCVSPLQPSCFYDCPFIKPPKWACTFVDFWVPDTERVLTKY